MDAKPSKKAQVGGGLLIAGIILALPGVSTLVRGGVTQGLLLLLIPGALIVGGLVLKRNGNAPSP